MLNRLRSPFPGLELERRHVLGRVARVSGDHPDDAAVVPTDAVESDGAPDRFGPEGRAQQIVVHDRGALLVVPVGD